MTRFVKHIILSLVLFSCAGYVAAQDIHFSQIFETPLLRNPALAGLFNGDIRVQTVYRSQWNSVTDAYKTGSANVEYKMPIGQSEDYITLGAQVLYDRAGTAALTSTHVLPAVNYHKSLGGERSSYLSLGFMGGWVQRNIDRSKLTTNSQYGGNGFDAGADINENFRGNNYGYADGSAGLSYNAQLNDDPANNMYIGVAYHHFTRPKSLSFYTSSNIEMAPRIVASAGVRTAVSDYSYLTIEGDFSRQKDFKSIVAGVMYSYKLDDIDEPSFLIHAGMYARINDAVIPVIKIEPRPLAISISYDINYSPLKTVSTGRGGFEISLSYQKYLNRFNSTNTTTRCPKF